jgi:hypothetical protein
MRIPIASKKPNFESSNDAVREQTHPPHFRADGWMYFLLRDRSACAAGANCPDSIIATDIGLIMGQQSF